MPASGSSLCFIPREKPLSSPPRANRKIRRSYDQDTYKGRHLIEDFFADLKQYRAIATRYDKTARNFLVAFYLAAAAIWFK